MRVSFFDFVISEPITTATDYLLGASALAGAILLWRSADRRRQRPTRLWAAGFAAVAAAAFLGGTWHGFSPRMTAGSASLLWKATLLAGGAAGFFLVAGAAMESLAPRTARLLVFAAAVKLGAFAIWSSFSDGFEPVVADSVTSLLAVLALQISAWARRRAPSAPWVTAGILVSLGAAAIEAFRIAAPPLGPDDVYHLGMIAGLALLCRGGLLFRDGPPASPAAGAAA